MIHNVDHQTSLQPSRWPHNSDQQLGAKEIQLTKGGESSPKPQQASAAGFGIAGGYGGGS